MLFIKKNTVLIAGEFLDYCEMSAVEISVAFILKSNAPSTQAFLNAAALCSITWASLDLHVHMSESHQWHNYGSSQHFQVYTTKTN